MDFVYIILVLCILLFLLIRKVLSVIEKASLVDWGSVWLNRIDGLLRLYCHRFHRLPQKYIPLPESGAAIVAANHISGLDPLLLLAASKRPLRFLIAREEYERFGLQWLFRAGGCIPVDRTTNPEKALRQAILAIDKGEVIAIFPQGGIQWPIDEKNPFRIKGGAVRLAQRKKTPLIPVVVDGVALKGTTMPAVITRSRAELSFEEVIRCDSLSYDEGMKVLAQKLNNHT